MNRRTWLGTLLHHTPAECRAEIERALMTYGGNVSKTARALGVSRNFFWYCLRQLGMGKVPEAHRQRWAERLRITPQNAASVENGGSR